MSKEEENRTKDGGVTADAAADPYHPHQEDEVSPPIADEEEVNSPVVEGVACPPSFISNEVVSPAFKRETDGSDFPQTFPQKVGFACIFPLLLSVCWKNHVAFGVFVYCKITILSHHNNIVSRTAAI